MKEELYYISLNYATFGLVFKDDKLFRAPPISMFLMGVNKDYVLQYYKNKKAEIILINEK